MNILTRIIEFSKGILLFAFFMFAPFAISLALSNFINNSTLVNFISQFLVLLLLILLFHKMLKSDYLDLKKNYKSMLDLAFKIWAIGLVVMMVSNAIINFVINPGGMATNQELINQTLQANLWPSLFLIVIYAPITEELVFRGGFKKAFKGRLSFAIFNAFFFGLMHLVVGFESFNISAILANWVELLYLIPYGALGFAFGYIYATTNNIYSAIIPHFVHNLVVALLLLLAFTGGIL